MAKSKKEESCTTTTTVMSSFPLDGFCLFCRIIFVRSLVRQSAVRNEGRAS